MAENATISASVESKVKDLGESARKNLRKVMRNLGEIRLLTGVSEVANLGKFLSEVSQEQESTDAPSDGRLRAALDRGHGLRKKLTEDEGGSVSAQQAAETMGMSKQAVLKRYHKGQLIGWKEEKQNAVRFPVWQFESGKVLNGLEEVLARLNSDDSMDDYGRLLFFLSQSDFLNGKRPLDCLRKDELHKVLRSVEGYVQ